jgi:hypothetical protein
MAFDTHSILAYSTVQASSGIIGSSTGTTIIAASGDGAKFAINQNITVWPAGTQATKANSEIMRITAIATDTLTVLRAQETTTPLATIAAGHQFANTITPKSFTDIETAIPSSLLGDASGIDTNLTATFGSGTILLKPIGTNTALTIASPDVMGFFANTKIDGTGTFDSFINLGGTARPAYFGTTQAAQTTNIVSPVGLLITKTYGGDPPVNGAVLANDLLTAQRKAQLPDKDGTIAMLSDITAPADATTTTKGIIQLTGDLAGTAAAPTVPGLASKAIDTAVVHKSGDTMTGPLVASATATANAVPIIATNDSSVGSNLPALIAQDGGTYAHTGDVAQFKMLNASDTGRVVRIENSGTGKNISSANGTTETFSVSKTGAVVASGAISGSNLSGTNTGDQTSITGNAATATTLQTPRTIAGVSFNGSANIAIASTNLSDTASIVLLTSTQTLTNKSLTLPKVDFITDTSGGKEIELVTTASSANWVKLSNTTTGNGVTVSANGTGANENLILAALGTGTVQVGGSQITTAANTQTITNKTMSGASNTFSAIPETAVTNLTTDLAAKVSGTTKITVSTTAPSSPATNDLWVDTN